MWWADPHIQTLVTGLAATFFALATYLKSRSSSGKLDTIKVYVNGRMSYEQARNEQLHSLLQEHGVEIPPPPDVVTDTNGNILVIKLKGLPDEGNS
jgi:hypothetical protein